MRTPTHLLMGGGGFSGTSYSGFLEGLRMFGYAEHIHTVTGISAGSMAAVPFICGTSFAVVQRLFGDAAEDARMTIHPAGLLAFSQRLGIFDMAPVLDIVVHCLRQRWPDVDPHTLTLGEFRRLSKITFNVLVTDLVASAPVVLNADTFPDVPVLVALRAATAIPFIMCPVQWQEHCWVDGWVTVDSPFVAHMADPIPPEAAIYLTLGAAQACAAPTESLATYIGVVAKALVCNKSERMSPLFSHHRVNIPAPVIPFFPVRWERKYARIVMTRAELHDAFLQGMDAFVAWHRSRAPTPPAP